MAGPFVSLQQILGAPNLLGIIKTTVSGIANVWEPKFFDVDGKCHGNTGQYVQYSGARKLSRLNNYGNPSRDRQLKELAIKPVVLMHSVENIQLKPTDYMSLLAYDDLKRQEMGLQEVKRQVKEFAVYQQNTRIASVNAMMFWDAIYWDDNGNILAPSAAGSAYGTGITYGTPATNTGQGTTIDGQPIITKSWSDVTADIVTQIVNLKKTAVQRTGYPLKRAKYGSNIPGYLAQNTEVQAFLARAQYTKDAQGTLLLEEGEIKNFLGLEWSDGSDASFEDDNGVMQPQIGPDQVSFYPEPDSSWVGMLEGTYPVPEYANIITQIEQVATSGLPYIEQPGMFSYGVQTADPMGLKLVHGDTFLPVLKVPSARYNLITVVGATS